MEAQELAQDIKTFIAGLPEDDDSDNALRLLMHSADRLADLTLGAK